MVRCYWGILLEVIKQIGKVDIRWHLFGDNGVMLLGMGRQILMLALYYYEFYYK